MVKQHLPCVSQVAQAFLSCMPSSGGLEFDFGQLKDIISPMHCSSPWIQMAGFLE
jgi:hypothetical protein